MILFSHNNGTNVTERRKFFEIYPIASENRLNLLYAHMLRAVAKVEPDVGSVSILVL